MNALGITQPKISLMKTIITLVSASLISSIALAQSSITPPTTITQRSNQPIEHKVQRMITEDYVSGSYHKVKDELYEYNAYNESVTFRDFENNEWKQKSQNLFLFDQQGDLEEKVNFYWHPLTKQWEQQRHEYYQYNANKQLTAIEAEHNLNGNWQKVTLTEYQYNSMGDADTILQSDWNGSAWEPARLTHQEFAANFLTKKLDYQLVNNVWSLHQSEEITYYQQLVSERVIKEYENGLLERTHTYEYSYQNGQVSEVVHKVTTNQITLTQSVEEFTYNSNGRLTEKNVKTLGLFGLSPNKRYTYLYQSVGTAVEENETASKLKIYPNPVIDQFKIDNPDGEDLQSIDIYNMNGKWIRTETHLSEFSTIQVGELPKGLYLIQLKNSAGQVIATQQLVKAI